MSDLPALDPACGGCFAVNTSVAGDDPSELFVAGYTMDPNESFMRQYDGRVWITYRLPNPDGPSVPPSRLWGSMATGLYAAIGGAAERFDFDSYQFAATGVNGTALWGSGAHDVWALDGDVAHHFDGTVWRDELPDTPGLLSVSGTAASDVVTLAEGGRLARYDGMEWHALPGGLDKGLHAVWDSGPGEVYAVAGEDLGSNTGGGLIARHDGTEWTVVDDAPNDALLAVAGVTGGNIYAVGANRTDNAVSALVIRYDGTHWERLVLADVDAFLWDAHCLPSGACYAVGTGNTLIALHLL